MKHYYYLHTNGNLIHKPISVAESDPSYFDGPFVRNVWTLDDTSRGSMWLLLIEAKAMGANTARITKLAEKWGATDEDAEIFVKEALADGTQAFRLFMDGDKWCATFHDFVDIQESQCGFGTTALEALSELAKPGLLGQ